MRSNAFTRVLALLGVGVLTLISGSASAITGVDARASAPGWVALIRYNFGPFEQPHCSGVVVGNGYVLTAAHCTFDLSRPMRGDELRVTIGRASRGGKDYGVANVYRMPGYVYGKTNDAALLQLHGISADDWDALPLAFEPSVVRQTGNLTLFGYGRSRWDDKGKPVSAGDLRESPEGAFQQYLEGCRDDLVCVRSMSGSRIWSMQGDSGGPWLRRVSGAWQVVGLASRVHFQNGLNDQWVQDDPLDAAIATSTLATAPDAQSLVDWVRLIAALPVPLPNTIVRNRFDGRSWLVGGDRYRRWIPTGGDFECFRAQGSRVINMTQPVISSIPDRVGTHAKCTPQSVGRPTSAPTTPSRVTPTAGPGGSSSASVSGSYGMAWLEGTTLFKFAGADLSTIGSVGGIGRPDWASAGDFNKDGKEDLFWYHGGSDGSIYVLRSTDSSFSTLVRQPNFVI